MRLEIWRKIGLSGDRNLYTALYALVVVNATTGLDLSLERWATIGQ